VVFDDGHDISMFRAADEACAAENADDELKVMAAGIIGNTDSGGVAHFMLKNS